MDDDGRRRNPYDDNHSNPYQNNQYNPRGNFVEEEELPLAAESTYLPNRRGIDTAPYNARKQQYQFQQGTAQQSSYQVPSSLQNTV